MNSHYEDMKEEIAICSELNNDNHEEFNDLAYEWLRPGSPYKFWELIKEDMFSPKKYVEY